MSGALVGRTFTELLAASLAQGIFELGGESPEEHRERRLACRRDPQGTFDIRTTDGRSWRITDRRTAEGGTVTTIWDLTDDVQREADLRQFIGAISDVVRGETFDVVPTASAGDTAATTASPFVPLSCTPLVACGGNGGVASKSFRFLLTCSVVASPAAPPAFDSSSALLFRVV